LTIAWAVPVAMSRSPRVQQLLRQLDLPAGAGKADIRAAYLKQVKVLHPDVAGKSAEERFRKLKEDYEEAMEMLKQGATPASSSSGPSQNPRHHAYGAHPGGFQRAHWDPNPKSSTDWSNASEAAPSWSELSSAQRLRNVGFGAFGVFGAMMYFTSSPSRSRHYSEAPSAVAAARPESAESSAPVAPVVRTKSDYYKNRTTRSSVRVRGSDTYVSPSEVAKSREKREGMQYAAPGAGADALNAATAAATGTVTAATVALAASSQQSVPAPPEPPPAAAAPAS